MEFTAAQISALVDGKIEGDENAMVSSFGKIEEAQSSQLSFLANPKYEEFLYTTKASIIIINESQEIKQPLTAALIRVKDAYSAFATILSGYKKMITAQMKGIQQPSFVSATVKMGEDVFIGAFAYIGENVILSNNVKIFPQVFIGDNVTVDDNTILYPGVRIYHDCIIGKNVTIHAGS